MNDLTLEQAEKKETRNCGTCHWFLFSKGPTGRKLPTKLGRCEWLPPWPEAWPDSYREWGNQIEPHKPYPNMMHPESGVGCRCWKGKA